MLDHGHAAPLNGDSEYGPFDDEPLPNLDAAERRALLTKALAEIELGDHDLTIIEWLAGWETSTVRTVAGWITRARRTT